MDALDRATVAKLRECAAALANAAYALDTKSHTFTADQLRAVAKSAELLADDIEKAEGGK